MASFFVRIVSYWVSVFLDRQLTSAYIRKFFDMIVENNIPLLLNVIIYYRSSLDKLGGLSIEL